MENSKTEHTPGPWAVYGGADLWVSGPDVSANIVCDIVPRDVSRDPTNEDWANARLIAAAPDLLAACRAVLEAMIVCPDDLDSESQMCAAAIIKAEGKSE